MNAPTGSDCATGGSTFLLLDAAAAGKMLGAPLRKSWLRFVRKEAQGAARLNRSITAAT